MNVSPQNMKEWVRHGVVLLTHSNTVCGALLQHEMTDNVALRYPVDPLVLYGGDIFYV